MRHTVVRIAIALIIFACSFGYSNNSHDYALTEIDYEISYNGHYVYTVLLNSPGNLHSLKSNMEFKQLNITNRPLVVLFYSPASTKDIRYLKKFLQIDHSTMPNVEFAVKPFESYDENCSWLNQSDKICYPALITYFHNRDFIFTCEFTLNNMEYVIRSNVNQYDNK